VPELTDPLAIAIGFLIAVVVVGEIRHFIRKP